MGGKMRCYRKGKYKYSTVNQNYQELEWKTLWCVSQLQIQEMILQFWIRKIRIVDPNEEIEWLDIHGFEIWNKLQFVQHS